MLNFRGVHFVDIYGFHVGRYTSPMDGYWKPSSFRGELSVGFRVHVIFQGGKNWSANRSKYESTYYHLFAASRDRLFMFLYVCSK